MLSITFLKPVFILFFKQTLEICILQFSLSHHRSRGLQNVMEEQTVKKPMHLTERKRIISMWLNGMSGSAIAKATGRSATTVCRWINRWRREGHVNTRPRSGRPYSTVTYSTSQARTQHSHNPMLLPSSLWSPDIHYLKTFYKPPQLTHFPNVYSTDSEFFIVFNGINKYRQVDLASCLQYHEK